MAKTYDICGTAMEFHHCITCGVLYSCPVAVMEQQRKHGGYHFCSNGHSQGWEKSGSAFARLERERDSLKQQMARVEEEKADAERKLAQAQATTKRIKKRASAGNCPCCKRTFKNMAEHMKHMHPEFVSEGGAKVVPIKRRSA